MVIFHSYVSLPEGSFFSYSIVPFFYFSNVCRPWFCSGVLHPPKWGQRVTDVTG